MDVNGDGLLDATRWAGAQDGVLVWDKYRDGQVHDHTQYAFAQYDTSAAAQGRKATDLSGLAAKFDTNQDGVFDAQDAQFAEFTVWQDANQNGVSDAGEVKGLAELGLASFNLTSDGVARSPVAGVHEAGRTSALTVDGTQVLVADVGFEFTTLDRETVTSAQPLPLSGPDELCVAGQTYKADQADQAMRALGPADVLILGMGADGHTASIFPGMAQWEQAVDAQGSRACLPVQADCVPAQVPHARITQTLAQLLKARHIVLPISGADKIGVLKRACGTAQLLYPISHVLHQTQAPVAVWMSS
jgi:hypothetical protein